jgi:hypothetical protein
MLVCVYSYSGVVAAKTSFLTDTRVRCRFADLVCSKVIKITRWKGTQNLPPPRLTFQNPRDNKSSGVLGLSLRSDAHVVKVCAFAQITDR